MLATFLTLLLTSYLVTSKSQNDTNVNIQSSPTIKEFNSSSFLDDIRWNETVHISPNDDDHIIRDEDVADDHDDHPPLNTPVSDGVATVITISSDAGKDIYQHWSNQAISGLMAAYATKRLENAKPDLKTSHYECTKNSKSVQEHAKCVSELILNSQDMEEIFRPIVPETTTTSTTTQPPIAPRKLKKEKLRRKKKNRKSRRNFRNFQKFKAYISNKYGKNSGYYLRRAKREVKPIVIKRQDSYKLHDTSADNYAEPLAVIAHKLTKTIRSLKNKNDNKTWQQTIDEIQEEGLMMQKRDKMKRLMRKRIENFKKDLNVINGSISNEMYLKNMALRDEDIPDRDLNNKDDLLAEAKEIEKNLSPQDEMMRIPIRLIREGVKLGMVLSGKNISDFDKKTLRMVSPKLMALSPDENNADSTINLLSPTLLSFHNDSGLFSLPSLLSVFEDDSQNEMMNFVFEASGVSDAVTMMREAKAREERKEMKENYLRMAQRDSPSENITDIPFMAEQNQYFTKENATKYIGEKETNKADHMEKLHKMFSEEQLNKLNTTGYVKMSEEQLNFFYGKESPFHNDEALERHLKVKEEDVNPAIEKTVHLLSEGQIKFEVSRRNDIVLTPILFTPFINMAAAASQPLILSPLYVVPLLYSPSVFGCVILSPWVFVPVLVSPRILGPVILSPIVFSPVILSPLVMIPLVLSPGVGVPLILSPFALTPFILSPVALTPLILSPFVLSPFILVPNVLSPMILSPFVLSPLILSPPAVSAFILNPYALSPIVKSDGAVFTAVLSPSWLS